MIKFLFAVFVLIPIMGHAFPEMVRHGYTQCTACHVSPAGGAILNSYGRELAAELLSTWSYENESQFLHSKVGAKLAEKGILFGGDIRSIQYHYRDPNMMDGKFFLMHADLQTAYQTDHFTAVVSVGEIKDPMGKEFKGSFNSTMFYGYLKFTDEFGLRAGRFVPAFGINHPDHTLVTRTSVGFAPTLQFDTVEASFLSERWTILGSLAKTVQNTEDANTESAGSLNVSYSFLGRMRAGLSYWGGRGNQLDRQMIGANAILGFTPKFYNMTEITKKYERAQDGLFAMSKLAYEVYKGIIPYIQYQHEHSNLRDDDTVRNHYGIGMNFFPRPHWEISGEWSHIAMPTSWADSAWLHGHYYFEKVRPRLGKPFRVSV